MHTHINQAVKTSPHDCISLRGLAVLLLLSVSPHAQAIEPGPQLRIIGGTEASVTDHPWAVALVKRNISDSFFGHLCTASLIHPKWVLTAGHCFLDHNGQINPSAQVDTVIGRHDLRDSSGLRLQPSRIVGHPDWTPLNPFAGTPDQNDILLLELPQAITSITPVSLPGQTYDANVLFPGQQAVAAGWGVTDPHGSVSSPTLQKVELPIVDQAVCQAANTSFTLFDTTLCAGPVSGGKDTCFGDSGGPLLADDGSGIQRLAGITSYGQSGCAASGFYGVYTRVSRYAQWVSDTACSQSEKPGQAELALVVAGNTATANFTSVDNALGYRLYYAPGPEMTPIKYLDLGGRTSFSTHLTSGADYFVAIQAYNGICLGPYSQIKRLQIP